LEEAGLLERERDAIDGRRATLCLTARGKQLNSRRSGTVEASVQTALASIPASKVRAAEDVLRALASKLNDDPAG
jgi:DNA-binding MarR family transcriptional regulator